MNGFARSSGMQPNSLGVAADVSKSSRRFMTGLLLVLFLSIYTEVPLVLTETLFVPAFVLVFSIPLMYFSLNRSITAGDHRFVAKMIGILVLSAVASPGWYALPAKLTGVLQTTVSITGGVLVMRAMDRAGARNVERLLFGLTLALVVGALLERLGVIRDLSDQFRLAAYHGYWGAYENLQRDVDIVGFERPKLFASEPSLLALGYFVFVNAWLLVRFSAGRFALVVALSIAFILLSGSPVVVVSMAVTAAIGLYGLRKDVGGLMVTMLIVGCAALIFGASTMTSALAERFAEGSSYVSNLEITSENVRLIFPFITAWDVVSNSPLFGAGISGKEVAASFSSLAYDTIVVIGNNNFWTIFTYFGLIGGMLFLWVLSGYIRSSAPGRATLLALILLCFSQMAGGFETPRIWGYVFILVGAARLGAHAGGRPAAQRVHFDGAVSK